jgi:hypothetical protein
MIYVWTFFTVFIIAVFISYIINKKVRNRHYYKFEGSGISDIPYVTIDIQGHKFNMIVDTGCGVSIITKNALDKIKYTPCNKSINLSALTSDCLKSDVVTIGFNIAGKESTSNFAVYNQDNFACFETMYGITIHGLLGNEFMEHTNCRIDYNNHCIIL